MSYNGYGGYTTSNPYIFGAQPNYAPVHSVPNYQQPLAQQIMQQQQPMAQQQAQAPQTPVQAQAPARSNKVFVASIDDATNRYAEPNSQFVYLHQDKPFIFEVFTDWEGKKTVKTYRFEECTLEEMQDETKGIVKQDLTNYVTREDLARFQKTLVSRDDLDDLESRVVQHIKQSIKSALKDKEIPID